MRTITDNQIKQLNKYNLTPELLDKVEIIDHPLPNKVFKELNFWRNDVINAWCQSGVVGSPADRQYNSENEWWIGIYDKPYNKKLFHWSLNCMGGMVSWKPKKTFFPKETLENEQDLRTVLELINIVNILIDNHIIRIEGVNVKCLVSQI